MHSIPVSGSRRDIVESLRRARAAREGDVVFASLPKAPLLPAMCSRSNAASSASFKAPIFRSSRSHLDQIWGGIFGFAGGRFFWKWPKAAAYQPRFRSTNLCRRGPTVQEVRQPVLELKRCAVRYRRGAAISAQCFIMAKRRWFSFCMADDRLSLASKNARRQPSVRPMGAPPLCR